MNKEKLKFEKMWEAANTFVFDIDTGSIQPILVSLKEVIGFSDSDWMFYYKDGMGSAYYEESNMLKAKEVGRIKFSDQMFVNRYIAGVQNVLKEQVELFSELKDIKLDTLSGVEIKSVLKKSVDLIVKNFGYYLACQPQYIGGLEDDIKNELSRFVPIENLDDAFALLSSSVQSTKIKQEEIDWLNLLIDYLNGGDEIDSKIKKHFNQYFLLNAADGQKPFTLGYYTDKYKTDSIRSLGDLKDDLFKISNSLEKVKNEQVEVIKKYSISEDVVDKCNILATIGHYRLEMRIVGWMPGYYYNQYILDEIARRFEYGSEQLRFSTIEEIYNLIDGTRINEKTLSNRQKSFLYVIEDGRSYVKDSTDADTFLNKFIDEVDVSDVRELKGNIAMKGKVIGKVVVFRWTDSLEEKMKNLGDDAILVTGQTRPQIMPLISRCKAIVTDEGGITSHAAIVSRELRTPCIIGTKIATQVFKDGDMVEVDADKGIVRIIK